MRYFILFSFIFIFTNCTSTPETSSTGGASWYNSMHRLSSNHTAIMPYLSDQKEFYNPANLPMIKAKTQEMMIAADQMTKDKAAPNANPMIQFTANQFAQELKITSEMLNMGKLQSAHANLSQIGNYCISCHSRADRGNKNFPIAWSTNLSSMNSQQKTLFYLANRQYESAHKETEKLVADSQLLLLDPSGWLNVIQKDLSVMVRVQQDIPRAKKMVEGLLKNKSLPNYMKYDAQAWLKSLKDWENESKKRTTEGTKNLAFAKTLLDKARSNEYSQGQAGFIIYLRASGILHELLESSRNSTTYPAILYFAGVSAEGLKTVDVWRLSEHYFEVCIETAPNTKMAQQCYNQLEWVVQQSHPNMNLIPEMAKQVNNRLAKYKDLAKAKNLGVDVLRSNDSRVGF